MYNKKARIRRIIKNKKGSAFPLTAAVILISLMMFTVISEYFRLMITAQGVKEALQAAAISVVNDNYDEVYGGVREGYSGGYHLSSENFEQFIDYSDIYERLDKILKLKRNGINHIKYASEKEEYKLYGLNIKIKNAPLARSDEAGKRFEITSEIILEVPVSFGNKIIPNMKILLRTKAGYTPKF